MSNRNSVAAMKRSLTVVGLVLAGAGLSGCSLVQGPVDREETFAVDGGQCTAQWWLGDLKSGVSEEAEQIADDALRVATVTESSLAEWQSILEDSQSGGDELSAIELKGQAYIEVVRAHVRDELDGAGYPDSDRVIEVWSDLACS